MRVVIGTLLALTLSALAYAAYTTPPTKQWVAITWSGDEYILGLGSTCNEAWKNHGPIPEDFRILECI